MDEADRREAARALESTRDGQSASWRNRATGDSFALTPTLAAEQCGRTCREFILEASVGGRVDKIFASACRQDDGNWRFPG
ncbi:outer membrane surface antigen [Variovorax sp. OK605]|nr:outer membrane surface antigen [Variovorax sp. OK605]